MVHEAIVAEPNTQRHSILSGRAVSLGNQINDTRSVSLHLHIHSRLQHYGLSYLCVRWIEDGDVWTARFNNYNKDNDTFYMSQSIE